MERLRLYHKIRTYANANGLKAMALMKVDALKCIKHAGVHESTEVIYGKRKESIKITYKWELGNR